MGAVSGDSVDWARYKRHEGDTGSAEVQIARLTARVTYLSEHCAKNKCDKHALLGLVKLLSKRRKLIRYFSGVSAAECSELLESLGIRK